MRDPEAMTDRQRRRELRDSYATQARSAGIYRIAHGATGGWIIRSTADLAGARSRFEFGRSTQSVGSFDGRLADDLRRHGFDALTFEVLDTLPHRPTASDADLRAELETLERLWAERLDAPREGS